MNVIKTVKCLCCLIKCSKYIYYIKKYNDVSVGMFEYDFNNQYLIHISSQINFYYIYCFYTSHLYL